MNSSLQHVIAGVDIGGSHIAIGIFQTNLLNLTLLEWVKVPVDATQSKEDILQAWNQGCQQVVGSYTVQQLGIAFPAPFDYLNGVCLIQQQGKFQSLFGVNVKACFANMLDMSPSNIFFLNDAASYLRGEMQAKTVGEKDEVLLLTFGTGLGSAWKRGEMVSDAALWSYPFLDGIAEDYFNTAWFTRKAFEQYQLVISDVKELVSNLAFEEVARLIFKEFAFNLSLFLGQLYEQSHADTLILGGNISKAHKWFRESLADNLRQEGIQITILINQLGELAPLYGAASFSSTKQPNDE
jgi:glucokinase